MPRHPYAGGYRDDIKAQLERIQIPEKVKCKTCKKIRMQNAFSKRQLEELRNAMLHGATSMDGPGYAKCRTCVGGQTVELTCCMCDKTKGLEHFSKNQRHDPDSARCVNCVQGHMEADPMGNKKDTDTMSYASTTDSVYDDNLTEPLSRYSLNDHNLGYLGSGTRTPTGIHSASHSMRAPSGRPGAAPSTNAYDSDSDHGGENGAPEAGVRLDQERRENHAQQAWFRENNSGGAGQNASIPFTGFDANGVPHARATTPSVAGSTGLPGEGWGRWQPHRPARAPSTIQSKRSGNFAKIKGTRFPGIEAPVMHVPEPAGQTVESDDDDDGDFRAEDWI